MQNKTRDMVYIGLFIVVLTICAWISVPTAIPFSLGTFGVFLAVLVLGGKRGSLAVLVYILLGCIGVPVFSGFRGGLGALLGYTGGYIVGYLFVSLVMWGTERWWSGTQEKKCGIRRQWGQVISMLFGLVVCYAFGTAWFVIAYASEIGAVGVTAVLGWCVLPYIIPDLIKMWLAVILSKRLRKALRE